MSKFNGAQLDVERNRVFDWKNIRNGGLPLLEEHKHWTVEQSRSVVIFYESFITV